MSHFICLCEAERGALARGRLYLGGVEFTEKKKLLIYIYNSCDQVSTVLAFLTIDFSYWGCI